MYVSQCISVQFSFRFSEHIVMLLEHPFNEIAIFFILVSICVRLGKGWLQKRLLIF